MMKWKNNVSLSLLVVILPPACHTLEMEEVNKAKTMLRQRNWKRKHRMKMDVVAVVSNALFQNLEEDGHEKWSTTEMSADLADEREMAEVSRLLHPRWTAAW